MKVYIVEDVLSGLNVNTETNIKVFSTEEKAIAYRNKLEKDYTNDYPDWKMDDKWIHYFTMVGNDWEDESSVYVYWVEVDKEF